MKKLRLKGSNYPSKSKLPSSTALFPGHKEGRLGKLSPPTPCPVSHLILIGGKDMYSDLSDLREYVKYTGFPFAF